MSQGPNLRIWYAILLGVLLMQILLYSALMNRFS
jgi:hypothetical protein